MQMGLNGLPTQQQVDLSGMPMMNLDLDMDLSLDGADANNAAGFPAFPNTQMPSNVAASSTASDAGGYSMAQEMSMSGAGAGPLPTGFGAPSMNPSGSTLTEFTKRRNWSQRVLEEIRDLLHILTPDGRILYMSPSCKVLTGWEPSLLIGRFINEFIHPDDIGIFVKEFNESIASGNPLRFFYRFRKADDTCVIFESHGHPHLSSDPSSFAPPNALNCRGFFLMARPYPTDEAHSGAEARRAGRERRVDKKDGRRIRHEPVGDTAYAEHLAQRCRLICTDAPTCKARHIEHRPHAPESGRGPCSHEAGQHQ
jgi:PAS domain S-box-containing protein